MTEIVDLWPDEIKVEKMIAPVTILRQQASLLGKKTKNIVQGKVEDAKGELSINPFNYVFHIVAPALNNYQYRLFKVSYGVSLYPLEMDIEIEIRNEIPSRFFKTKTINRIRYEFAYANSEDDFLEILRTIFNSTKVMHIISVLLSQSDPSYDPSLKEEISQIR